MDKPIVNIKDAFIVGDYLYGVPIDYPEEHMWFPGAVSNTKQVRTSKIVHIEKDTVETQYTRYAVINWIKADV